MKTIKLSFAAALCLLLISSCVKDIEEVTVISYTDDEYAVLSKVVDLPNPVYDYGSPFGFSFGHNPFQGEGEVSSIHDHRATLGRVLFHESRLSQNNSVSCESCHHQADGFADDRALSEGFDGELTKRNSLALNNVSGYASQRFFWDERAHSIEEQTQMTIEDHIEMGMDMDLLPGKLDGDEYYRILFTKAFGDAAITKDRISGALAAYVRSINSSQAPFDEALEGNLFSTDTNFPNFTAAENRGKSLFMNNCSGCHGSTPSFTFESVANNGLDQNYADKGVGEVSGSSFDNGKFKVPILRNIALSAPYMHDGRFETLEEVVEHYSNGIQDHENLHILLKDGTGPRHMNFSEQDKSDLVAFLHTLTDEVITTEDRFADPFK